MHTIYSNIRRIIIGLVLIVTSVNAIGQKQFTPDIWLPGEVTLENKTTYRGEFILEEIGEEHVTRHKKENRQNTYPASQVSRLLLYDAELNDTLSYQRLTFEYNDYTISPAFLFQVLYESDSFHVYQTRYRTLKFVLNIIPILNLGIYFEIGKKPHEADMILMANEDSWSLTLINDPNKKQRGNVKYIDGQLVIDQFLTDHFEELSNFVNKNELNWQLVPDFIQIVEFYDHLK